MIGEDSIETGQKTPLGGGFHAASETASEAATALAQAQAQLVEISRQAGMAEIATGVLHNVGNVLNSVNVSVTLLGDQVRHSKRATLTRVCALLESHRANIGEFLTSDPKGQLVPELLSNLAAVLEEEQGVIQSELKGLVKNVEHIKEIVSMQQSYAGVAGAVEDLPAALLVEDAVRINEGDFLRLGIEVERAYEETPSVRVEKHKVLQIMVNLLRNALHAVEASGRADKLLTLSIKQNGRGYVEVVVKDNGIGIEQTSLTRIFAHGFTTKTGGHGFGLHSGALAAKEMGGSLQARSDGPGTGATLTLELPIAKPRPQTNGKAL